MIEAVRKADELSKDPAFRHIIDRRIKPTDLEFASDASLRSWLPEVVNTGLHLTRWDIITILCLLWIRLVRYTGLKIYM